MGNLEKIASIIKEANEKEVIVKDLEVFGYQYNYGARVIGSVNKYWFGKHEVKEFICPLNSESKNENRPGTIKESTEYVVVHDTASAAPTANSLAHAKYVTNGGGGTSWHYSAGCDAIYHQVPDSEVAYHAGDGLKVPFKLIDTGVSGKCPNPKVEIIDGYYYLDGKKTLVLAPKVTFEKGEDGKLHYCCDGEIQRRLAPSDAKEGDELAKDLLTRINDQGLRIDLIDGKYYMGPTYFSPSYGYISNRGGNLHSIGIETMVNEGSDLYLTWQRCAKLCAHLCLDNNLGVDRIKPHHFFSGKDCPMTMRHAGLWENFLEMAKVEYEVLKLSKGIEIEFTCDSSLVDENGRVKELPEREQDINYQVTIKDGKDVVTLDLTTHIRGKLEYRTKTDDRISLLGFGTMRLPTIDGKINEELAMDMIDYAYKQGINYFDTAYMYHSGESERFLGRALDRYPRASYNLATKLPLFDVKDFSDVERIFNDQLNKLHKDYFDYYLFHALNKSRFELLKKLNLIDFFKELKKTGKIRHIGFSFHDDYEVFEEIVNYFDWDFCQIQLNYLDTVEQAGLKGLALCKEKGIPVVIMEPVKGGALAKLPSDVRSELDKVNPDWSSASWAFRYLAQYDNIMCILSGMSTFEQVEDNINTFKSLSYFSKRENDALKSALEIFKARVKNSCTGCSYCMPCPFGVNIPKIFRVWNEINMYDNKNMHNWTIDQIIKNNQVPSLCVKCGRCEGLCPQHLQIRKDLERVDEEIFKNR